VFYTFDLIEVFFKRLMKNRIRNLRIIGISEGVSFLVLLLIAMPLKYYAGIPQVVKVVGWAHGLLFLLYIATVFMAIKPMRWNFLNTLIALAGSLIPLGTFFLDRSWKRREKELI
jgi:integral membrane protein